MAGAAGDERGLGAGRSEERDVAGEQRRRRTRRPRSRVVRSCSCHSILGRVRAGRCEHRRVDVDTDDLDARGARARSRRRPVPHPASSTDAGLAAASRTSASPCTSTPLAASSSNRRWYSSPSHLVTAAPTESSGSSVAHRDRPSYPGPMPRFRVAAAQLNVVVGDLEGNAARILEAYERGRGRRLRPRRVPRAHRHRLPARRPAAAARVRRAGGRDARQDRGAHRAGRGGHRLPRARAATSTTRRRCARTAACYGVYRKQLLPNYAVFDEQRYFVAPREPLPLFNIAGVQVGVSICEDAWSPTGPILAEAAGGAELIVNLNASPYYAQRLVERETMLATRAADASVPIVYANLVGGQDELVFDGASLVFDEQGALDRACQAVRGGSARRRPRRASRVPQAPARSARSGRGAAAPGDPGLRAPSARRARRRRGSNRCSSRCTRSTRRWCSARATTCARTASPTW